MVAGDRTSRRWVEHLRPEHPRHARATAQLHDLLQRAAFHELHRRRGQLGALSGPEFDDVAHQCADDAMMKILARIDDFEGRSRFTTWAYKFVIFEVSNKVARHAWRHHPPSAEDVTWDHVPDTLALRPGDQAERREQLAALVKAIDDDLTPRQREVFVAIALNDVTIDVLALQLRSNRNAIYKNLFDARRKLRARLAAAGHPGQRGGAARPVRRAAATRLISMTERSAIMTRKHMTRSLIRRLRPSPERFAAAAALHDLNLLLQLRAAHSNGKRPAT